MLFSLWRLFHPKAKSVDPDEMLHFAAFHLDLHCLQKYPCRVFRIQRVKHHLQFSTDDNFKFCCHFSDIIRLGISYELFASYLPVNNSHELLILLCHIIKKGTTMSPAEVMVRPNKKKKCVSGNGSENFR